MEECIGKTKIIKNISKSIYVNEEVCEKVIDAFIADIIDHLTHGCKVILKNFMILEVIERSERESKNFKTGEPVTYPAVKSVKCKISKTVRDAVNFK